jgi:GDPmannose 4,6-dehydratase
LLKALVTGCTGQDGSYLTELLIARGYDVWGLVRPGGDDRMRRLRGVLDSPKFNIIYGDLTEPTLPYEIASGGFAEVYHLAAQTQVAHSFSAPAYTMDINATSTLRILEALKLLSPHTKFYFAATSEMFADMDEAERANEKHPLGARSPYGAAKVAAYLTCKVYRQTGGMFVVNGISFNHESRRRGENFVTRKVGLGVQEFKRTGKQVRLGNLSACRDWHHAADTMHGAYLAMHHSEPYDYVFASGSTMSVGAMASIVCDMHDVKFEDAIVHEPTELRPWDVDYLCGDPTRAEYTLGWERAYTFIQMLEDVCHVDE